MPALEIMQDLFFIERGYLNGNHFVYRSPEPVLIDTAYLPDFNDTKDLITNLGVSIAEVRLIINTHTHCDHIGGNKFIQEESGCDIALHKVGKHFIDMRDDWSTWWRYFGQEAEFFTCTTILEEGDIIPIGPHEFQVIYTPGHASDGIVLYNKKEKILISSDALWESDVPVMVLRVEGSRALFEALQSLDKLDALDVKIAYPGHGQPFTDVKGAIAKARQRIKTYMIDRERLGIDVLKKMIVYALLMYKTVEEDTFFVWLMETAWFKELFDFHFGDSNYQTTFNQVVAGLCRRGIIKRKDGKLLTTVKP